MRSSQTQTLTHTHTPEEGGFQNNRMANITTAWSHPMVTPVQDDIIQCRYSTAVPHTVSRQKLLVLIWDPWLKKSDMTSCLRILSVQLRIESHEDLKGSGHWSNLLLLYLSWPDGGSMSTVSEVWPAQTKTASSNEFTRVFLLNRSILHHLLHV